MKVSVFGLGVTGTVSAACLAEFGHDVIAVDIDRAKVDMVAGGRSPILVPEIDSLVSRVTSAGRLSATQDLDFAIAQSDLSLICLGSDTRDDGARDTKAVEVLIERLGVAIASKDRFHSVVVRTTTTPGTVRGRLLPLLQQTTGSSAGECFGLASNPEFMRESNAIADFRKPARIVIGEIDAQTAEALVRLYYNVQAPVFRTKVEIAEAVKLVDNVWHSLKVAFANEIGAICGASGLNGQSVMEIFRADGKLNLSSAYLRPGFAFGGPCLPNDVRALVHYGSSRAVTLPIISNLTNSNDKHLERGVEWLLATGKKRFAMLGISFTAGSYNLRGSQYLRVAEQLEARGCLVRAYDVNVERVRGISVSKSYTSDFASDDLFSLGVAELIAWAEAIVVTANLPEYVELLRRLTHKQVILDFAGVQKPREFDGQYLRFC